MPVAQSKMYDGLKRVWAVISRTAFASLSEPEIARDVVRSKSIATMGYDVERECLQVEYFNGILYRVDAVSPEIFKRLQSAQDFDDMFMQEVHGRHQMTRIGSVVPFYV